MVHSNDSLLIRFQTAIVASNIAEANNVLSSVRDQSERNFLLNAPLEALNPNSLGLNPLLFGCLLHSVPLIRFLVTSSADIDICDANGWGPAHYVLLDSLKERNGQPIYPHLPILLRSVDNNSTVSTVDALQIMQILNSVGAKWRIKDKIGRSPLFNACQHTSPSLLQRLLECEPNIDINAKDSMGVTPLHEAASFGSSKVIKELIDHGANVDVCDLNGKTPLHVSSQYDHVGAIVSLLSNGANTSIKDVQGRLPRDMSHVGTVIDLLCDDSIDNDINQTRLSVPADGVSGRLNDIGRRSQPLLNYETSSAASSGPPSQPHKPQSSFQQQPQHVLDVEANIPTEDGVASPSPMANRRLSDKLQLHGISIGNLSVDRTESDQQSAEIIDSLPTYPSGNLSKILSCDYRQLKSKNFNMHDNEDINSKLLNGCRTSNLSDIDDMLQQGASVNCQHPFDGMCPLSISASQGNVQVCRLLLGAGADPNLLDSLSNSPLHWAALNGHSPLCHLLVSFGSFIDAQNDAGSTPLHEAALGGQAAAVRALIALGADVDIIDHNGRTSCVRSSEYGFANICEMLSVAGADIHRKDYEGRSPLGVAPNIMVEASLKRAQNDRESSLKVETEKAEFGARMLALAQALTDAKNERDALKGTCSDLQKSLKDSQETVEALENDLTLLRDQEKKKEKLIEQYKAEISSLKDSNENDICEGCRISDELVKSLKVRMEEMKEELSLREPKERKAIRKLEERKNTPMVDPQIVKQLEDASNSMTAKSLECSDLQKQLKSTEAALVSALRTKDRMEAELAGLKEAQQELRTEIRHARDNLERERQDHDKTRDLLRARKGCCTMM